MDIINFNKKLNKITLLSDTFENGVFSTLERDLLLTYIRDLYDIALGDEPLPVKKVKKNIQPEREESPVFVEETHVYTHKANAEPEIQVIERAQEVKTIVEPISIPKPKSEVQFVEKVVAKEEPVKAPVTVVEKVPKAIPLVERIEVSTSVQNMSESDILNELFSEGQVNDLSDKLALTPVQDLTKSMGINERIFTQQELFANNSQDFTLILTTLNSFQSFDDAKQYLINKVIPEYGWMQDNKIKKAATFIKLVKRKFY